MNTIYHKYKKYKSKYLNQSGGKQNIQFILFGDVMTGDNIWFYDMKNIKIDFINKLKKIGNVIILKPNYINFMQYSKIINNNSDPNRFYKTSDNNISFTIEDLQFENYSKWVFAQIDPNKKYIAIGLDQGCHFAKYFVNQYSDNCLAFYILIDRNLTKENYEKTFLSQSNYDFIKSIIGSDWEKYLIKNITNETIENLLNLIKTNYDNEKYINLLNGICKGIIRSQYSKITELKVKTIIYSDILTATPEKIKSNTDISEKHKNVIYYYIIDNSSHYLIHGKYRSEILNNIYCLLHK